MSRFRRILAAGIALAAVFVVGTPTAGASISNSWQVDPQFYIHMEQVPGMAAGGTKAAYRLLDPEGDLAGKPFELTPDNPTALVQVPAPGAYTLDSQLEDAAGQVLRRASVVLRFDDAVPAPPALRAPGRWLPGGEPVVLEFDPPTGPLPASGIRGYEVTVNGGDARLAEPGDSFPLGFLPEGVNQARVVTVSGSGMRSEARTVTLAVDATAPDVSLQGLPTRWSSGPVKLTAIAHDSLSGMEAAGVEGPFTAIAVDGSSPTTAPGPAASTWLGGSGVHTVRFYGRDAAGNIGDGGPGSPPPRTALVGIDEERPRVEFAAAQDPADPEWIEALVSDALSGPSSAEGSIAVRPAGTRARFEPLPTRVRPGGMVARWNSDSYPPGKYEFLATGFDAAGNSATGSRRVHGGRMVLVNPLKTQVMLSSTLTGVRFGGSLRRTFGGPVPGQTLAVTETFVAGSESRQRITYLRTDPDGGFSLRLEPGPSRKVSASFAGSRVLTRAGGPIAHFAAATAIRFGASTATAVVGGKPVLFSGRVGALGARRAVSGLPVELQFRYPGAGWSEFRTVEADSRGRFHYAYRFSDDDSRGVRFRFRAYVKGREGWPYGPGASRPVSVRGR